MKIDQLLSIGDFEREAQTILPRVVFEFVSGGAEDNLTRAANRQAFRTVQFRPRGLAGVANREQTVTLWGRTYRHPFGIAPMGVTAMCRHRCEWALAQAAAQAHIPFVLSGLSTLAMETVREAHPGFHHRRLQPRH